MNTEELLMVEAYSKLPTFKLRINKALDIIREGLGKETFPKSHHRRLGAE